MNKKLKKFKVGLNSETKAISLVENPAIEIDFIHMSEDEKPKEQVFLESDEKYMIYGPILVPDKDIYRNTNGNEYYLSFSSESIEKMSQEYMKDFKQFNVTLNHKDMADEICLVESWIVTDSYRDKANYLGFSVPTGTWMGGMKVNNIDTWNKIKSGELKGFSVESLIERVELNKIEENNNTMTDTNDMGFWTKMKEILEECFSSPKVEEPVEIEPTNIDLEAEPAPVAEPAPEPVVEPSEPQTEPEPTTTKVEENNEPVEPVEPEKTLEELKSEKLSELTSITSHFDNQLVNNEMVIKSSLGFSINADLRSQNNLRGLIAIGIEPVNFVTADNSVKSLTLEQLNVLLSECAQNGQNLYLQKWAYKAQIENVQTKEELEAIEFKFTMKDFS